NDALARAAKLAGEKLRDYEPPPFDAGKDEELRAFIARRKEELPSVVE
ncbi:MAG: trimethylamine methyltransferase family protein, partial [Gammaproteobacteria bacterium]|nr:trimethylamine methyltransferase family protein [Gammaproteobacteria bacterium]